MLQVASVRARVNTVSTRENTTIAQPIDDLISFSPVNLTRVITLHYDAIVLIVYINGFYVHRVLVDLESAADLLHLPAFKKMRVSIDHLSSAGRVLSGFNGGYHIDSWGYRLSRQGEPGDSTNTVLGSGGLGAIQCHLGSDMSTRHESHTLHIPSNHQLPDRVWAS